MKMLCNLTKEYNRKDELDNINIAKQHFCKESTIGTASTLLICIWLSKSVVTTKARTAWYDSFQLAAEVCRHHKGSGTNWWTLIYVRQTELFSPTVLARAVTTKAEAIILSTAYLKLSPPGSVIVFPVKCSSPNRQLAPHQKA